MPGDELDERRSSFDRVVDSLDAVIRRHPAGSALRDADNAEARPLPDNVVDLRSRLAVARSGAVPDDAA
jgi:hypothetical protein